MTYRELGKARGISVASAARLAFRKGWQRQPGNDGAARVAVPIGEDQPSPYDARTGAGGAARHGARDAAARHGAGGAISPGARRAGIPRAEEFALAIEALRERAVAAEERADRVERERTAALAGAMADRRQADARADAAERRADQERQRADRAEAGREGERVRADDLRAQIDVLNTEMVVARAAADRALAEERQRADRLSEQVDAGHHDLDAVRAEADAQRTTIDELKSGQALMTDMHARELAAAQDRLERVRDAAEAIRQAEAERKARGLVARLRAALRRE